MLQSYISLKKDYIEIPNTDKKYYVDKEFNINYLESKNYQKIIPEKIDNVLYILLKLKSGERLYNLNKLLLSALKPLKINDPHTKDIEAVNVDNNIFNYNPNNLIWKFPKNGIMVPDMEGFYYIPGFTRYAINNKNVVIDLVNKKERKWSIKSKNTDNCSCYIMKLLSDSGTNMLVNRNRVVLLSKGGYPANADNMIVGYKNKNNKIDHPDNLEFIYPDSLMAVYDKSYDKYIKYGKVLMKDVVKNNISEFSNVISASRYMDCSPDEIIQYCDNKQKMVPNFKLFQFKNYYTNWRIISDPIKENNNVSDEYIGEVVPESIVKRNGIVLL